jgi:hypothetical protein
LKLPPLIDDPPENLVFEEGTVGKAIFWHPYDFNPSSYVIYRNGTEIALEEWNGSVIRVPLELLGVGTYNYTLIVYDETMSFNIDSVLVTVTEPIPVETTEITTIKSSESTSVEVTELTTIKSSESTSVEVTEPTMIESSEPTSVEVTEPTSVEVTEPTIMISTPLISPGFLLILIPFTLVSIVLIRRYKKSQN